MRKYLKQGKYSYDENQMLGSGSFGKVYKGYNHQTQQWIALKQIQLKKLQQDGEQLKEIVLGEITVMKKFAKNMRTSPCDFLVAQQDCFRTQLYIYIVMELCQGGTLQQQMKKKRYSQAECKYIIYCIAKGLQYMGKMNIVHRDLKPQNIFISKNPQTHAKFYKIGDFGFATHKQKLDLAMGTLLYMAPQMFKRGNYTNKVDIWSFGVICYQIFFRMIYFSGKDKWAVKKNIIQKQFKLNQYQKKQISADYQNFLQLCLLKQPQFRIASQNLFKHPFLSKYEPPNVKIQTKTLNTFQKIQVLITECQKLRSMAEKFSEFSEETSRCTQFIQIYLLKDAYSMMNRIAYTMVHQQDYIGMDPKQFAEICAPENTQKYSILTKIAQNQCLLISGLFNEKYKQFSQYIKKFTLQDINLISKVVNQQPYQYTNERVMQKQLEKWSKILKKYPNWRDLQHDTQKVYNVKISN